MNLCAHRHPRPTFHGLLLKGEHTSLAGNRMNVAKRPHFNLPSPRICHDSHSRRLYESLLALSCDRLQPRLRASLAHALVVLDLQLLLPGTTWHHTKSPGSSAAFHLNRISSKAHLADSTPGTVRVKELMPGAEAAALNDLAGDAVGTRPMHLTSPKYRLYRL